MSGIRPAPSESGPPSGCPLSRGAGFPTAPTAKLKPYSANPASDARGIGELSTHRISPSLWQPQSDLPPTIISGRLPATSSATLLEETGAQLLPQASKMADQRLLAWRTGSLKECPEAAWWPPRSPGLELERRGFQDSLNAKLWRAALSDGRYSESLREEQGGADGDADVAAFLQALLSAGALGGEGPSRKEESASKGMLGGAVCEPPLQPSAVPDVPSAAAIAAAAAGLSPMAQEITIGGIEGLEKRFDVSREFGRSLGYQDGSSAVSQAPLGDGWGLTGREQTGILADAPLAALWPRAPGSMEAATVLTPSSAGPAPARPSIEQHRAENDSNEACSALIGHHSAAGAQAARYTAPPAAREPAWAGAGAASALPGQPVAPRATRQARWRDSLTASTQGPAGGNHVSPGCAATAPCRPPRTPLRCSRSGLQSLGKRARGGNRPEPSQDSRCTAGSGGDAPGPLARTQALTGLQVSGLLEAPRGQAAAEGPWSCLSPADRAGGAAVVAHLPGGEGTGSAGPAPGPQTAASVEEIALGALRGDPSGAQSAVPSARAAGSRPEDWPSSIAPALRLEPVSAQGRDSSRLLPSDFSALLPATLRGELSEREARGDAAKEDLLVQELVQMFATGQPAAYPPNVAGHAEDRSTSFRGGFSFETTSALPGPSNDGVSVLSLPGGMAGGSGAAAGAPHDGSHQLRGEQASAVNSAVCSMWSSRKGLQTLHSGFANPPLQSNGGFVIGCGFGPFASPSVTRLTAGEGALDSSLCAAAVEKRGREEGRREDESEEEKREEEERLEEEEKKGGVRDEEEDSEKMDEGKEGKKKEEEQSPRLHLSETPQGCDPIEGGQPSVQQLRHTSRHRGSPLELAQSPPVLERGKGAEQCAGNRAMKEGAERGAGNPKGSAMMEEEERGAGNPKRSVIKERSMAEQGAGNRAIKERSMAERQRRERISEGLQRLRVAVRGQGDTASMLEHAVGYVEGLQRREEELRRGMLVHMAMCPLGGEGGLALLGSSPVVDGGRGDETVQASWHRRGGKGGWHC